MTAPGGRRATRLLLGILLGAASAPAAPAQTAAAPTVGSVRASFARPPDDSRVMMRWWWFGPAVTREEIEAEMRRMKEGGLGGFELAVVYPMALDDPASGLRNERYLSPVRGRGRQGRDRLIDR